MRDKRRKGRKEEVVRKDNGRKIREGRNEEFVEEENGRKSKGIKI